MKLPSVGKATRMASIRMDGKEVGALFEYDEGYDFFYTSVYLEDPEARAISLTLPLTEDTYHSKVLFPFFDGLIPEGWLMDVATKNWKADSKDRMGLLLAYCEDCIGNVSIKSLPNE